MQSFVCQLNRVGCKTNKLRVILEAFDILYLDGADAEENHHLFIFGVDFKEAIYSEPDIHTECHSNLKTTVQKVQLPERFWLKQTIYTLS